MTVEDDNVALLRESYRLWAESRAGSVEPWLALAADDIALHTLGGGRTGAPARGKAALRAYLASVADNWEMLTYEVAETIAQGERVVVIVDSTWRSRRTGRIGELQMVNIWRMRDGKAVEFAELYDTALALAAAQGAWRA
jgi:ketosteroid isomerase-like protein